MRKSKKAKTETRTLDWAIKETLGMINNMLEILSTKRELPEKRMKDVSKLVKGIGRIVMRIEKIVEKREHKTEGS